LKFLRVDLKRGGDSDSKCAICFRNGVVWLLRHGGATTGHRAGILKLVGEERLGSGAVCQFERENVSFFVREKESYNGFFNTTQSLYIQPNF
jgi:hypothetical protein